MGLLTELVGEWKEMAGLQVSNILLVVDDIRIHSRSDS